MQQFAGVGGRTPELRLQPPLDNTTGFLACHMLNYDSYTYSKTMMTPEPLNVFVIGSTGVGKSSLLSMLVRPDSPTTFKSALQTASVTQSVETHQYCHETCFGLERDEIRQYQVNLIDSPGLNDSVERGMDLQHIYNLIDQIKDSKKLHSLLFVAKLGRFDVQFKATLKYCCSDLFSKVPDNFIKIVLTHLDEDTFLEFKESSERFEETMADIRQQINGILEEKAKAIRIYLVFTGRRRGISKANIEKYIEYFRHNSDLVPTQLCKDEWAVENLDFHTLYFRDRLIYDIHQDTAHFNWNKSRVMIPPSIHSLKTEALLKLYKKKAKLTKDTPTEAKLIERVNGLIRQEGVLKDEICRLKNDNPIILSYKEYFSILGGLADRQCKINLGKMGFLREGIGLLKWHDNSSGLQRKKVFVSGSDAIVSFDVVGAYGTLLLDFYLPGEIRHKEKICKNQDEIRKLRQEVKTLQGEFGEASAKLQQIDKRIKRLERSHVKMKDLEEFFQLI